MDKYIIRLTAAWCGIHEDYAIESDSIDKVEYKVADLLYDLFDSYNLWEKIAVEYYGYDEDDIDDLVLYEINSSKNLYEYSDSKIEKVLTEDQLQEWKDLELIYT